MSIDLAAILIGVLAIIVSVFSGIYAASAISSEYVAKITSRLIALDRKIDNLVQSQSRQSSYVDNGSVIVPEQRQIATDPPAEIITSDPSQY